MDIRIYTRSRKNANLPAIESANGIIRTVEKTKNSDVVMKPARTPRFLLLMPEDLRHDMEKSAAAKGRTLTAEINIRLRESQRYDPTPDFLIRQDGKLTVGELKTDTYTVSMETTETDRAMLSVFRRLSPEKQLALISLFK